MSGSMIAFDFRAFMSRHCIGTDFAQKIFLVSRRTICRWRVSAQLPATAAQLARSIDREGVPWNSSIRRSWRLGIARLHESWRLEIFGEDWQRAALAHDVADRLAAEAAAAPARADMAARTKEKARTRALHASNARRRQSIALQQNLVDPLMGAGDALTQRPQIGADGAVGGTGRADNHNQLFEHGHSVEIKRQSRIPRMNS